MSYAALIGGVVAVGGIAYNEYQKDQNKKDIENSPKYQIPNEVYQNHSIAMNQAIGGLPAATKNLAETQINNKLAYSNQTARDLHSGLVGLADANSIANGSEMQLAAANAEAQLAGWDKVMAINNQIADQKGLKYQLNQLNPYLAGIKNKQVAAQNNVNAVKSAVPYVTSLAGSANQYYQENHTKKLSQNDINDWRDVQIGDVGSGTSSNSQWDNYSPYNQ